MIRHILYIVVLNLNILEKMNLTWSFSMYVLMLVGIGESYPLSGILWSSVLAGIRQLGRWGVHCQRQLIRVCLISACNELEISGRFNLILILGQVYFFMKGEATKAFHYIHVLKWFSNGPCLCIFIMSIKVDILHFIFHVNNHFVACTFGFGTSELRMSCTSQTQVV